MRPLGHDHTGSLTAFTIGLCGRPPWIWRVRIPSVWTSTDSSETRPVRNEQVSALVRPTSGDICLLGGFDLRRTRRPPSRGAPLASRRVSDNPGSDRGELALPRPTSPVCSHSTGTPVALDQALKVILRITTVSVSALPTVVRLMPRRSANSRWSIPVSTRAFLRRSPIVHSGDRARPLARHAAKLRHLSTANHPPPTSTASRQPPTGGTEGSHRTGARRRWWRAETGVTDQF